ncbi:hypothetical protein Pint_32670 [Pistacia integerrima]|uniref:Uncharacterized protein n=1 Tax=Pistacia integerrima TaxID=434235 RepID=A0ACC0XRX2_9ROSI|nr:hypothetical protein Pint_32670 [Pistacia integerrima]
MPTFVTFLGNSISNGTWDSTLAAIEGYITERKKEIKPKEKYFKQNGGLLLQQQLTSSDGSVDRNKLFNSKDLEKATDHFNVNRVLGEGGQGTVYKRMLTQMEELLQ